MRVLIVEDETLIRQGLISMVDWAAEGFSTCLEAASAVDALEILQDHDVDVVITDIFMPVINGLEMIATARQLGSHAAFVILTGHERFEYAQEAIRLGVRRFLVKPVSEADLHETLREIREERFARQRIEASMAQTEEKIREYEVIVQEKFWTDLLGSNAPTEEDVLERAKRHEIFLSPRALYQCVALWDGTGREPPPLEKKVAMRQALRNQLAEDLLSLTEKQGVCLLVVREPVTENGLRSMHLAAEDSLGQAVRLGVSQGVPVHQLHAAAEDAIEAVNSIRNDTESEIAFYADLLHSKRQHVDYPRHLESRLFDMLRFHESVSEALVTELVTALFPPGVPPGQSALMLLRLRVALYRFAEEYGLEDMPPFGGGQSPFQDVREAQEELLSLVSHMAHQRRHIHQRAMEEIAGKARDMIGSSYPDAALNVASIAASLFISPGYLSRVFRLVQGETCMAYLTRVRLHAAQELLRNTCIKSYEIAGMVGYSSPNYFSALFKKHVGLSPRQYRGENE